MLAPLVAALSLFRTPVPQVEPDAMAILHITDIHADPFYDGAVRPNVVEVGLTASRARTPPWP